MQANRAFGCIINEPTPSVEKRGSANERSFRPLVAGAFVSALCLGVIEASLAQSSSPQIFDDWQRDWTVLAMAPDGAWGVGTDEGVMEAITQAVGNCQTMSGSLLGCGANLTTIRAGWSLGLRCGDTNIVIAEFNRDDAEFTANAREYEMRNRHYPDLPPCIRTVMVDPSGKIVESERGR